MNAAKYLLLLSLLTGAPARADSSSASGSCSRTIEGLGYFYAYQYVYRSNGAIGSESHSLSFSGFLGGMENAKIIDHDERHVFYLGERHLLAVPYVKGAGLHVKAKHRVRGPGREERPDWVLLCQY